MSVRRTGLAYIAACLSLFTPLLPKVEAQNQQAPQKTFTLEQAVAYALQNYPAVRASLERVSAARAGVTLARTGYLPQLNGVYQDSRATQNQVEGIWLPTPITPTVEGPVGASSGQSFWGSQAAALFSWEPVDFGLRSAKVGQAQSAEAKSQADLALTQLQVAAAVGNYFLLAVANQQAVMAARANLERWQEFHKSIHVLVDNQLRAGADGSRADAELARAKIQLYQSQQAERVTLHTLAALMGTAGTEIKLDSGRLLDPSPAGSLPDASVSEHPLARDQLADVRQIQTEERVLQRTDYPRLYLQGEVFGRGSEVPTNGTILGNWNGLAPARENWVTGMTVMFPDVFGLKALSAQKQISKANERSQKARYDQTIQDLSGQIQAARDQLNAAQLVAQETPTELTAARQSETQSRARYQSGLATLVEVADAENLLVQAEMEDSIARLNVWHGLFAVASAQGNLQDFLQLLRSVPPGER
ncbi:MAG: TolC family protein [Candidatus Acidiferrales bacterium]